jgi:hypothetical protein
VLTVPAAEAERDALPTSEETDAADEPEGVDEAEAEPEAEAEAVELADVVPFDGQLGEVLT